MKRAISRRMYNKIKSMYWMEYETKKYRYSIDMWNDILRTEKGVNCYNPFAKVDRFTYDSKANNWKLVIE